MLDVSHAATPPNCRDYLFTATGTNNPNTSVKTSGCVGYIQDALNGAYQVSSDSKSGNTLGGFAATVNKYTKANGISSSLLSVDGQYGPATNVWVHAFQATFQFYNPTAKAYQNLGVDGQVGPQSWGALCGLATGIPNLDKDYNSHSFAKAANNDSKKAIMGCTTNMQTQANQDVGNSMRVSPHVPSNLVVLSTPSPVSSGGGSGGSGGGTTTSSAVSCTETDTSGAQPSYYQVSQGAEVSCKANGKTSKEYQLINNIAWWPSSWIAGYYNSYEAVKSKANLTAFQNLAQADDTACVTAIDAYGPSPYTTAATIASVLGSGVTTSKVASAFTASVTPKIQSEFSNPYSKQCYGSHVSGAY